MLGESGQFWGCQISVRGVISMSEVLGQCWGY